MLVLRYFVVRDVNILTFKRLSVSFMEQNWCYFRIDIDECSSPETNDCDVNAKCENTGGSYECSCVEGYQGDGKNCIGKF